MSYLITCQNEDGGFGPQPGEDSTLASTSLAAIALAAAGMDPASQFKGEKSTADYLIESAPDLANSSNVEAHTGRYVVALVSAGLDPVDIGGTDYVEILRGILEAQRRDREGEVHLGRRLGAPGPRGRRRGRVAGGVQGRHLSERTSAPPPADGPGMAAPGARTPTPRG